jgi:hypothetical protein
MDGGEVVAYQGPCGPLGAAMPPQYFANVSSPKSGEFGDVFCTEAAPQCVLYSLKLSLEFVKTGLTEIEFHDKKLAREFLSGQRLGQHLSGNVRHASNSP